MHFSFVFNYVGSLTNKIPDSSFHFSYVIYFFLEAGLFGGG